MSGRARLADFGLLAILPDSMTSSSCGQDGTTRWMSPELFDPEMFGLRDSRQTKPSDCYALGMVVYEVLSGQVPFAQYRKYAVVAKVLKGERPKRPQGVRGNWFTDDVWGILERCWTPEPSDRPRIDCMIQCLEEASGFWTPLSPLTAGGPQVADSSAWTTSDLTTEGSRMAA